MGTERKERGENRLGESWSGKEGKRERVRVESKVGEKKRGEGKGKEDKTKV